MFKKVRVIISKEDGEVLEHFDVICSDAAKTNEWTEIQTAVAIAELIGSRFNVED